MLQGSPGWGQGGYHTPEMTLPRDTEQVGLRGLSKREIWASLVALTVRNLAADAGDAGSIPGSGRSAGEGNGSPSQYSCLENSMDKGVTGGLGATVDGVRKSWTQLTDQAHTQGRNRQQCWQQ